MIIESISDDILKFLGEIENLGFSLCLVGGVPRDYFYCKTIGLDFDFEIRPAPHADKNIAWPDYYKKLHQFLAAKKVKFTQLPYLITRVEMDGNNFEFSSPRVEKNIPDNYSHHHFEASLNPYLTYAESFKRRDFTINAIGIELNIASKSEKIIDPCGGLEDLKKGILRHISDDFFLDSVRFLRLVRFSTKFESFKIDEMLAQQLNRFNLMQLSAHHFKEELKKSKTGAFLNAFSSFVTVHQLSIPQNFEVWTRFPFPSELKNQDEILAYVFLQDDRLASLVLKFFSLPEKKLKDLKSFVHSLVSVADYKIVELERIAALSPKEALNNPLFKELKNLEEKKDWRWILKFNFLKKELPINWDDWSDVSVTDLEMNQLMPAGRAHYRFYKALKKKYIHG